MSTLERPILISAAMVRALLSGTKTQTRRIVKPQPHGVALVASGNHLFDYRDDLGDYSRVVPMEKAVTLCPHGQPGDRLWVREDWRTTAGLLDKFSGRMIGEKCLDAGYTKPWAPIQYEADKQRVNWQNVSTPPHDGLPQPGLYRHALFMPRWASRITLEITEVRVQRLQDISEADARAEGCRLVQVGGAVIDRASDQYAALWESINGTGSWDANPWVWAISFKRLTP